MKKCSRCLIEKALTEFHKNKTSFDGFRTYCKVCYKVSMETYHKSLKYKECLRISQAKYNRTDKRKATKKRFLDKVGKDYMKKYWNSQNRKAYIKNKIATDPVYKLKKALRTRLYLAIRGRYRSGIAIRNLGCSIPDFLNYFETLFQPGMSWENHGKWHIDHIRPLTSFDLSNQEEITKSCHYTNLQPLWEHDNLSKGNRTL